MNELDSKVGARREWGDGRSGTARFQAKMHIICSTLHQQIQFGMRWHSAKTVD